MSLEGSQGYKAAKTAKATSNLRQTSTPPSIIPEIAKHSVTFIVRLLLRLNSSASDECIENADDFWFNWQQNIGESLNGKSKKTDVVLSLKHEQTYHLEYYLPLDDSRNDKNGAVELSKFYIDIIGLQFMAKVYYGRVDGNWMKFGVPDDVSMTTVRYFRQNQHTFLLLEVEQEMVLTEEMIRRLSTHKIQVDIYESIDKICLKAKIDLRNFKRIILPTFCDLKLSDKDEAQLLLQKDLSIDQMENQRVILAGKRLVNNYRNALPEWKVSTMAPLFPPSSSLILVENQPVTPMTSPPQLALLDKSELHKRTLTQKQKLEQDATRKAKRKLEANKTPVMTFQAFTSTLFTESHTLFARGVVNLNCGPEADHNIDLVSTLYDGLISICVKDGEFLSMENRVKLNPMTISIKNVENLPTEPVDFETLRHTCHPAYFQFNKFGMGEYKSTSVIQEKNLCWDEPVVIFMASVDTELLKELFAGPPWEFYLYDRDRKDGVCTNSCAVARLDLYPLIAYNLQEIEYDVPVTPLIATQDNWSMRKFEHINILKPDPALPQLAMALPRATGTAMENVKERKKSDKPAKLEKSVEKKSVAVSKPASAKEGKLKKPATPPSLVKALPPGRYQDYSTTMRIKVSVALPLEDFIRATPRTGSTPFCRCILVLPINSSTLEFTRVLITFIACFNGKVLELAGHDRTKWAVWNDLLVYHENIYNMRTTSESGDALNVSIKEDLDKIDVLTGFHVCDKTTHIFIVEGLFNHAMTNFSQFITSQIPAIQDLESGKILWDSSLRYSRRLYGAFGMMPYGIQLNRNLDELARESYVRLGKFSSPAVAHLIHQLHQIAYCCKTPREIFKQSCFPETDALRQLRHVFGEIYSCAPTAEMPILEQSSLV